MLEAVPITVQLLSPREAEANALILEADAELDRRYPAQLPHRFDVAEFEHDGGFFAVAREGAHIMGCGGFHPLDAVCVELRRLFVRPEARRRGVARLVLQHLEAEARHRNYLSIVLETGVNQPEAIALYLSEDYFPIPAFQSYVGNEYSRCFAKKV